MKTLKTSIWLLLATLILVLSSCGSEEPTKDEDKGPGGGTTDTQAPVLTFLNGTNIYTLGSGSTYNENLDNLGMTDNVATRAVMLANLEIETNGFGSFPLPMESTDGNQYRLIYQTSDEAGNISDPITNFISFSDAAIEDTTPPVITLNGDGALVTNEAGATWVDPVTVSDNSTVVASFVTNGSVDVNTLGSYDLEYIATDEAGNATTNNRTVVVADTLAPSISLSGGNLVNGTNTVTWLQNDAYVEPGYTASDSFDTTIDQNDVVRTPANDVDVDTTQPIDTEILLSYTVEDASMNSFTSYRIVILSSETNAPTLTLNGDNPYTNEVNVAYVDPGYTASDVEDTGLSAADVVVTTNVNTNVPGTYTNIYTVTDNANNTTVVERVVVVNDTVAPEIVFYGSSPTNVEFGTAFDPSSLIASVPDNYTNLSVSSVAIGGDTLDMDATNTYSLTFTATDAADNAAVSNFDVTVADTIAPVFAESLVTTNVEVNSSWTAPSFTATDANASDIVVSSPDTDNVLIGTIGTYTNYYTADDTRGNTAVLTNEVVVEDNTAPVITVLGGTTNTTDTVAKDSTYTVPAATVTDNSGETITVVTNDSAVDTSGGTFDVIYTASDSSGNSAALTNTVTVLVPHTLVLFDGTTGTNGTYLGLGEGVTNTTYPFIQTNNDTGFYIVGETATRTNLLLPSGTTSASFGTDFPFMVNSVGNEHAIEIREDSTNIVVALDGASSSDFNRQFLSLTKVAGVDYSGYNLQDFQGGTLKMRVKIGVHETGSDRVTAFAFGAGVSAAQGHNNTTGITSGISSDYAYGTNYNTLSIEGSWMTMEAYIPTEAELLANGWSQNGGSTVSSVDRLFNQSGDTAPSGYNEEGIDKTLMRLSTGAKFNFPDVEIRIEKIWMEESL